ncbi:MAG: hypothetical protein M1823_000654 [Watsoniomyces obsoletus]|nr:MAG: hypothetical protein M1823_000654 [Watsoniomyces obsoletus]
MGSNLDRMDLHPKSYISDCSLTAMPFQYKKVLVLGATSGIGEALAARFVQEGAKVIVTGRRKENLDAFVQQHGDRATAVQFDITRLDQMPSFAQDITESHPDLDCIVLNSGIQRGINFADPTSINLSNIDLEFTTNYLSYIHLVTAFLPFLLAKKDESALIFVSSGLAIVPLPRCPNYCASKAAIHQLVLSMREQLKNTPVKMIEVMPPAVQTELHDEKHQPDIKNGSQIGMPLPAFTEEAYQGLARGDVDVPVGMAKAWYEAVETPRMKHMAQLLSFFATPHD